MIAELFQQAISAKGHTANIEGNQLTIPSIGLILKLEELKTVHGIGFIGVDLHHPSLLPNGLKEVAIGTGSDDVIRTKAAVHSWTFTDYPVLYAYMSPAKVDMGVHRMSVVSQHDNEVLGWRFFIGPLYTHGYASNLGKDSDFEMYHALFDTILIHLTSPEVIAMKFSISVNPQGKVSANCRVNGGMWDEGAEALLRFGKTIFNGPGEHYREQFLLITPTPLSEIDPSRIEDLKRDHAKATEEALAKAKNGRRWFEFWKWW
ncbi:MAG: DUF6348 family protein [Chryseolinea sp.]